MPSISSLIKQNRIFFIVFAILLLPAIFITLFYSRADGFFLANPFHTHLLDVFFTYYTWLGNGIFCLAVAVIFLFFKNFKAALLIAGSFILSGIAAQVLKHIFPLPRPKIYLVKAHYHYFIEHVTLSGFTDFPSGHTASAFALATSVAIVFKNKSNAVWLILYATIVGYSRIYLGQHFLTDVMAGAIIGVLSAIVCWYIITKRMHNKQKGSVLREPLFKS
ncbi:MAG: phosphatase PAP2 family protein [Chitinophagaceae bacterium]|nr:phosphatase PAP2 family protein [Chitinophagaceae bacterium]